MVNPNSFSCQIRIGQAEIASALDVGATNLRNAVKAIEIVNKYGPRGAEEAAEFVERIERSGEKEPEGSGKLFQFVKGWGEKEG